ncbi:unnamed protein product [Ceratitis capitata]|uniref:(Mediterranean fruit fly) hypothetical protein n=1 Tax=Ceratitis capitata TaxID=7213 RepID=A0A811VMN8_CERCA|nr:unnamed protein product [Ceratitis capitata]
MFWGLSEALDLYQEYCKAFKIEQTITEEAQNQENANINEDSLHTLDVEEASKMKRDGAADDAPSTGRTLNVLLFGAGDPRHVIKTMAKMYQHKAVAASLHGRLWQYPTAPTNAPIFDGQIETMLKMVTDDELLHRLAPQLNIEGLRYRERDGLENAFNFLLPREGLSSMCKSIGPSAYVDC